MSDSYISYKQPEQEQVKTSIPPTVQKSIQRNNASELNQGLTNKAPLGFAGGGAIAAIVVGIIAIALAGTALYEANDHGEDDHRFSKLIVGCGNKISNDSSCSMIGGGSGNSITQDSDNSFIGGGLRNTISRGTESVILGGRDNALNTRENFGNAIISGRNNTINQPSVDSIIASGSGHTVSSGRCAIIAGNVNSIGTDSRESVILGGDTHAIGDDSFNSGILAGREHTIQNGTSYVVILGGRGLRTFSGSSFHMSAITGLYNNNGVSELQASSGTATPGSSFRFMVGGGNSNESRTNAFTVDNLGNIYFGTSYGASIFSRQIDGSFGAGKSFTIQHPEEEERWLVHGCLEGPEAGVYYRGKDVAPTTVKLPKYATKIADNFTVQVTPIGQPRLMSSTEVNEDGLFDVMGEGKFHWHATGRRLEIDVEPHKNDIIINRWGPYTWNQKI